MRHSYHTNGTLPQQGEIFVFGSNTAGVHGKGAALIAHRQFGAVYGNSTGLMGQSYGIPTRNYDRKTRHIVTLPLQSVEENISQFCIFTHSRPDLKWWVTAVGCGYAGFHSFIIAPHFRKAINCSFPVEWVNYLEF